MNEPWVESKEDVERFIRNLNYALDNGPQTKIQISRQVDEKRDPKFTNKFSIPDLFPEEDPRIALRRELRKLSVEHYLRTVPDIRCPENGELREFGIIYAEKGDVYIKIRVKLLDPAAFGNHTVFIMSFHYAETPFSKEVFPHSK